MNIAMRKLVLLEKDMLEREERARIEGYSTNPSDFAFRENLTKLIDKVRVVY